MSVCFGFLFCYLILLSELVWGTVINLVMITSGNPRFGLVPTGPAYDVAIENMKVQYPDALMQYNTIRRIELMKPGVFACDPYEAGTQMQLAAGQMAELVSRLDGFTVLLAPGCSLEIMVLGDFAREWDIPLLASSASDQRLANKKRYPTVTAYGPVDLQSFANAAKLFMDRYTWSTVTLFCDKLTRYPLLSTVYVLLCQNIQSRLEAERNRYTINVIQIDSENSTKYEDYLTTMRAQSRIIFIFTRPSILRDILVTSDRMNMTNGEYVFIAPESTKQPTLGDVVWHRRDGRDDAAAFRAFQSTIVMAHPSPDLATSGGIFSAINKVSEVVYNKSLTEDEQMNDVVVCAYMSVGTLAMVINENYDRLGNMSAREFSRRMWNKTYSLDILDVFIDDSGMKKGDVQFQRLNSSTGKLQTAWIYSTLRKRLSNVSDLAEIWLNRDHAPADSPRCGFQGEKCSEDRSMVLLITIVTPLAILAVAVIVSLIKWRYNQIKDRNSLWWCMDANKLNTDESAVVLSGGAASPITDDMARQDFLLKCQFKLRMYENSAVWTESVWPAISRENIGRRNNMRKCLAAIKNMHHGNVGQFIGVVSSAPAFTYLVWEFGSHGSLRMLLDTDTNHAKNHDLLVSMVWDVLEGVEYIHSSDLHFHGACSSLTAMVDKRFCIKLCGYGSPKMLSILTGCNVASEVDTIKLWMAPEMLVDTAHPGSKNADVFSIALIILEIFTQCTPMDAILESETSCRHAIENLTTLKIPRIPITQDVPQLMHEMVRFSFAQNPRERPTLKMLSTQFGLRYVKQGFVDKILSRLKQYSEDLENKVAAQTHDLIEEQQKVDLLLKQMIPPEFVDRLRNKEVVPCESYDCATIFFSDLPEFGAICASSSPLQIISLLNLVYSTFDVTLENFDVYKVETVNDSYMVVSGLPKRNGQQHVCEIAKMALSLINTKLISPVNGDELHLRVGIHSGSVVAGIVGSRLPRYCLFGDTVNTASRMESHGEESRIHISPTTRELLATFPGFVMQSRGKIAVKGKGDLETFWLIGRY